jgi:hypothetical protein
LETKQKLESQHSLGVPTAMKLIFQGRILTDDATLEASGVVGGSMLVVMVSKVIFRRRSP